jgi:GNAT superfamily N-acetyltransferase
MDSVVDIREIDAELAASFEALIPEFEPRHDAEAIRRRLGDRRSLMIGAYIDGEPVGYKIGYAESSTVFYSWIGGVLPHARRRGVARLLMRHQESWCARERFQKIRVKTHNGYRAMLQFLIADGYDVTSADLDGNVFLERRLAAE